MAIRTYAVYFWISAIIFRASINIDLIVILIAGVSSYSFRIYIKRYNK